MFKTQMHPLNKGSFLSLDFYAWLTILPSEATIERNHYKIAPTNAHIPHMRPNILVWSRLANKNGVTYIYSFIKNINIFVSHKSSHKHKIHHMDNTNMATIMIGCSYGLQRWSYIERLDQPQTHSLGGGILPSHGGEQGGDIGEGEEAARGDSDNGSPSNLHRFSLCFMVSCFSTASLRECSGVFI
jgi:hypothetical protein